MLVPGLPAGGPAASRHEHQAQQHEGVTRGRSRPRVRYSTVTSTGATPCKRTVAMRTSPREREVLSMYATGNTLSSTARRLGGS